MLSLLAVVAIASAPPLPTAAVTCHARPIQAYDLARPVRPKTLAEMPPARAEYAVMRSIAGCMVPAPVGYHPAPAVPDQPAGARPEASTRRP